MSDIFRRLSNTFRRLAKDEPEFAPQERRRAPRLVCSAPILWEVGRDRGEGQLREVSASGLRIQTNRAILAGKNIRISPLSDRDAAPLSTDIAIGVVVYSRRRGATYELGIELINPERISRFAWISQLLHGGRPSTPLPVVLPQGQPLLRLLSPDEEDTERLPDLLKSEVEQKKEKNSKKERH